MTEQLSATPSSFVELSISARELLDMDLLSKSDPMCVLYKKETSNENWREIGRTEIIWNNLNPDFVRKFNIDYFFEVHQMLKFEFYDIDCESSDLSRHDFLGQMTCSLAEIVTSERGIFTKAIQGPKPKAGRACIRCEELSTCRDEVTLQFRGEKLERKDLFGKSDPFLEFRKKTEDGPEIVIHRTEVIKVNLNPVWRPITLSARTLCNGDYDRVIGISCYDWNRNGSHNLIGHFETTLSQLREGPNQETNLYSCVNPEKRRKKGKKYKDSGKIRLLNCHIEQVPSFLDYISGGTELQCILAVDFTQSNGDPRSPESRHFLSSSRPNQYESALLPVMEIIRDYDSDKIFPTFGFGAKLPTGKISHQFHLNGNLESPDCHDIAGVMDAYRHSLNTVSLWGPTNFSPIINRVVGMARELGITAGGRRTYFILVILTDGIISDLDQTKRAVVAAAKLPISIIIIGIGDADFTAMEELDGDDIRVSYNGVNAERDIVQFVPISQFLDSGMQTINKARLAREVLEEIPDQLVGWMRKNKIKPIATHLYPSAPPMVGTEAGGRAAVGPHDDRIMTQQHQSHSSNAHAATVTTTYNDSRPPPYSYHQP